LKWSTTLFASLLVTLVVFGSLHQIARPSVMQEENTLTDAPERRRPELI
jgi:hypothetical protein